MSHVHGETVQEVKTQSQASMRETLHDLHHEMATIRTGSRVRRAFLNRSVSTTMAPQHR